MDGFYPTGAKTEARVAAEIGAEYREKLLKKFAQYSLQRVEDYRVLEYGGMYGMSIQMGDLLAMAKTLNYKSALPKAPEVK